MIARCVTNRLYLLSGNVLNRLVKYWGAEAVVVSSLTRSNPQSVSTVKVPFDKDIGPIASLTASSAGFLDRGRLFVEGPKRSILAIRFVTTVILCHIDSQISQW
jgi:hypothetical protein